MRDSSTKITIQLAFVLALFFLFSGQASSAFKVSDTANDFIQIGKGVQFSEDKSGTQTIQSILASPPDWQLYQEAVFNAGYSQSDWWLKFELENVSAKRSKYTMEVDYPVLDYIDVYIVQGSDVVASYIMGDKLPFKERPTQHRLFRVPIDIPTGQTQTVYIRLKSSSSIQAPIKIWNIDAHQVADVLTNVIHGIYIGGMLIIGIYNLLIYLALRDRIYLFYVSYVFSMLMFLSSLNGWTFQYLWPESTNWNDQAILIFLNSVVLFTVAFANRFLALKKLGIAFQIQTSVWIAIGISGFLLYMILPYRISIRILIPCAALGCLWALSVSIYAWRKGHRSAGIYIISWAGIFVGGVLLALNKLHLIPRNAITDQGVQLGSLLEVMLLSFALAQRINYERVQRISAQQKALEVQNKAKQELEANVAARTKELEIANRRLQELSDTDQLTLLKNRRFLDKFLDQELQRSVRYKHPLTVMLIDIDHFKAVNDTYGHLVGDECLKEVARRFGFHMRFPTDLCARYGGEEFCVVLPETPLEGALVVAERIRKTINGAKISTQGFCETVTVSIGVFSKIPESSDSAGVFLENADKALYTAKENGRDQVQAYTEPD